MPESVWLNLKLRNQHVKCVCVCVSVFTLIAIKTTEGGLISQAKSVCEHCTKRLTPNPGSSPTSDESLNILSSLKDKIYLVLYFIVERLCNITTGASSRGI